MDTSTQLSDTQAINRLRFAALVGQTPDCDWLVQGTNDQVSQSRGVPPAVWYTLVDGPIDFESAQSLARSLSDRYLTRRVVRVGSVDVGQLHFV